MPIRDNDLANDILSKRDIVLYVLKPHFVVVNINLHTVWQRLHDDKVECELRRSIVSVVCLSRLCCWILLHCVTSAVICVYVLCVAFFNWSLCVCVCVGLFFYVHELFVYDMSSSEVRSFQ